MSSMSLLSIEKTRKKCFVLVGVNCFGVILRSSPYIMECRLDTSEVDKVKIKVFLYVQDWQIHTMKVLHILCKL